MSLGGHAGLLVLSRRISDGIKRTEQEANEGDQHVIQYLNDRDQHITGLNGITDTARDRG